MSRYRFIHEKKAADAVTRLCRVAGVARSASYAWARRGVSARARADEMLAPQIAAAHARSRRTYGAPRVHAELHASGVRCGRKRVARLLRAAGLVGCCRQRRPRTTVVDTTRPPAPNLVARDFAAAGPNRRWVGTAPICQLARAGCTWRCSSLPTPAGWSAGRWPTTAAPHWRATRWRWRSSRAARRRGSSTTPIAVASTRQRRTRTSSPPHLLDEPSRRMPGQRHGGKLLLDPQGRTDRRPAVGDARGSPLGGLRVARGLVQPSPSPLGARLPTTRRFRGGCGVVARSRRLASHCP